MAISDLDAYVAGMQEPRALYKVGATMEAIGVLHSFFYTSGLPGAASAPSPGINGETLSCTSSQVAGCFPWSDPVSGHTRLAKVSFGAGVVGRLYLFDRIWQNSGIAITTTTEQAITSPTWPARDMSGATAGAGIMVGLEVSSTLGNGAVTNTTLRYTNSAGTDTRTATISSFAASALAGTFVPFQLQAGDQGVRSIQGLTLGTTYVSGTMHLVAYRQICSIGLKIAAAGEDRDGIQLALPRLYNGSCLWPVWRPSATTAITLDGEIQWTQG